MLRHLRTLATTTRILNRGESLVNQVILDQLKDSSKLNRRHSSILILDPKSIQNNTNANKYENKVSRARQNDILRQSPQITRWVPNIFQDEDLESQDSSSYIKLINNLRVYHNKVSDQKFKSICSHLSDSFTAPQLRHYIKLYYETPEYKGAKKGIAKRNKSQLCSIIVQDLWNVKKSGLKTSVEDFLISNEAKLQKKDLFLLLYKDGLLIKYLSRTGCKISFDSSNDTIKFTGTESQINSANIILDSIIVNSYQQEEDLKAIKPLLFEKSGDFVLAELSKLLQVHIEQVNDTRYKFTSFNANQHKRAKRLLIWLLDYNPHLVHYLKVPAFFKDFKTHYFPFKDDESISWNERLKSLFRLTIPSQEPKSHSDLIDSQLKDFSDENLLNKNLNTDEINEVKSYLTPPELNSRSDSLAKYKGNLAKEDPRQYLTSLERDDIFSKLSSFDSKSPDVDKSRLLPPTFTVTFGNVLFENQSLKEQDDSSVVIPHGEKFEDQCLEKYLFNSNIPLINDQILNLPYFNEPDLTVRDINNFRINDPHDYLVQIKFQPSLYENESVNSPPVELWVNLNKHGNPELNSLKLLAVENENNYFVPLPTKSADLKISSQLVGDLFQEEEEVDELDSRDKSSIESLLKSTTSKYARFRDQPGLDEFLQKSQLDFSGKTKPVIHPTIQLRVNGKDINYQYISMNHRRQLEFLYKNKLLQFSLAEGGSLGGRKSEVTLVGNLFDKEALDDLIDDSIALVNKL